MVSEELWRRKFSSSPEGLGKTLSLDGMGYTIVGVIPASFDLSLGSFHDIDVYVPVGQWSNPLLPKRGAGLGFHGIGRTEAGRDYRARPGRTCRMVSSSSNWQRTRIRTLESELRYGR